MLVIHGLWAYGAAQVWAEDSTLPEQAPPRPGRVSRAPRPHPFAAPPEVLAAALASALAAAGLAEQPDQAVDDEIVLRLPSGPGGPLAAPELVRPPTAAEAAATATAEAAATEAAAEAEAAATEAEADAEAAGTVLELPAGATARKPARSASGKPAGAAPSLAAWRVPVLAFGPDTAGPLLTALAGLAPGDTVADGSIGYLAAVARFAADLAVRGRVIPALTADDDGYAARWRPVLSAADTRYARELAGAMPPACRALADGASPAGYPAPAPEAAPGPLLAQMLDALTDTAVRTRLPATLLPARRGRRPARIAVSERMVLALAGPQPLVDVADGADEREARDLTAALAAWLRSAALPAGAARTCFRLVEPLADEEGEDGGRDEKGVEGEELAGNDAPWQVEFSLQSAADPSLMLPAADVWAGTGYDWLPGGLLPSARYPEEELLAGLGAAARLFPALDGALHEAAPAGVTLDTAGALDFLRETGPLLAGAGFGVLTPDWARKARLGLKLTTRSSASGPASSGRPSQFGLQDLVNFRFDLALGDDPLSAAELEELARLKVPLVRVRGQWVELDDRHLKAALKFLQQQRTGTMTAAAVIEAALGSGAEPGDLPLTEVAADGWLGDLLSGQADERLAPMAAPAGFGGTLRPYQQRGLSWLSFLGRLGLGAVLADDMGLGKTVQLLALLASPGPVSSGRAEGDHAPVPDDDSEPALLICPMSLVGNWQRESERFAPGLSVHVHHGTDRRSGHEFEAAAAAADLVITTYQTAVRDLATLSAVPWRLVVCDEAQAIKNHLSQQAKAVRALPAGARIALTGTPVENQLSDLWSLMEFANPGLLGPEKRFRTRFAVPIERHGSDEAAAELRRITQPFVLRRLKTDKSIIFDLPDKQEMKVWCNLTQEQASLYAATVSDMMARIGGAADDITRRGLVLATMAKLKQVCNHPAHLLGDGSRLPGRSGKLARLEELCEEIVTEGDRALCFTQYAEFGRMLQPYLAARIGCPVLFLHGGLPKKQRDALVARFQEADEPVLFLLSLKAGGTGLNLTAANHVIHVDRWWNPAVEDQATDRAFRIGQRRNVQVRKFVCVGTLEEKIDAMIEGKKALAEQVIGTGEGWLTGLSTDALREVLTLSPEAVSA